MKVGVIMGGISSEREISLNTGKEIVNNLDKERYQVQSIIIDKKTDIFDKVKDLDFALLALHGKFGEDGTVQSVLQTLDIPYSGCNALSSALCMDKDMTKKVLIANGINTADWVMVKKGEEIDVNAVETIGYPLVVKPNSGGSSVATGIVRDREELVNLIYEALKYDNEVMVEKYIKGDEITCCILDGKMLPVIAIRPKSSFFDFTSKYSDGGAEEVIVELQPELHNKVEAMALSCWRSLKCSVYARVDMLIQDGEPYVLEINTLPGMTKNSLFPKSAAAVGMSFSDLLDNIIQLSLKERQK
ncbi:D-alanine--D-alanine ligase [Clostridium thermarum]|uniref:D-alanine--D-alanine ligase n=1 Tax=Clostridium thermarum TaxID=1716543 RepID=UPI0013D80729|nr:D-alanine--D-alanine ligase [Clostridium thermarum]